MISVGDTFYERESEDTRGAKWGEEPPMPTIFCKESDLKDWWESVKKIIAFVRAKNEEQEEEGGEDQRAGDLGEHEDQNWVFVPGWSDDSRTDRPTRLTVTALSAPAHANSAGVSGHQLHREKVKTPLTLSAAHVTTNAPALPTLLAVQRFMCRVLRDEVPFAELVPERGERVGLWDDFLEDKKHGIQDDEDNPGSFSVKAPLRIIEEGRQKIPKDEWK